MRCSLKKGFFTSVCLFALFVVFCGFNTFLSDDYHLQQKQKTDNKTQIVQETNGLLLMLIISAPFHLNERQVVRQTWLSYLVNNSRSLGPSNVRAFKDPTDAANDLVIHYWFVCGHYYDNESDIEGAVKNESNVYGDILRLEYTESYILLVHKTLSSLRFASKMDVRFVLKIDDDVYLHFPRMIWWLRTASLPDKLYGGYLLPKTKAIRDPLHKWHVSEQHYNETYFPPYCNGPFYFMSKAVVLKVLEASFTEGSSFPLEDVFIGILAQKVGVKPIQLNEIGVYIKVRIAPKAWKNWKDSNLMKYYAIGHGLTREQMFGFHSRYRKLPFNVSFPPIKFTLQP